MKVEMNLSGLDGVLNMLQKLPAEVVSKNGGPVRKVLRKAARLIQKEAKASFASAVAQVGVSGITDSTGFTERQIIVKKGKYGGKGERQVVTVKYGQAHPSGGKFRGRPIFANDIAFIMEAGTSKQPATPWIRPAFVAKAAAAIRLVETELPKEVERIAARLAKK
jgi:HK97 gp10 family phage protein